MMKFGVKCRDTGVALPQLNTGVQYHMNNKVCYRSRTVYMIVIKKFSHTYAMCENIMGWCYVI